MALFLPGLTGVKDGSDCFPVEMNCGFGNPLLTEIQVGTQSTGHSDAEDTVTLEDLHLFNRVEHETTAYPSPVPSPQSDCSLNSEVSCGVISEGEQFLTDVDLSLFPELLPSSSQYCSAQSNLSAVSVSSLKPPISKQTPLFLSNN